MKRWLKRSHPSRGGKAVGSDGYTITEALAVLAVTAMMFAAVLLVFSGRQSEAEFTQAVRNYEAMIQNVISDVTRGYYQPPSDSYCHVVSEVGDEEIEFKEVMPEASPPETGTNKQCVFIGKLLTTRDDSKSSITKDIVGSVGSDWSTTGVFSYASDVVASHSFQLEVEKMVSLTPSGGVHTELSGLLIFNSSSFVDLATESEGVPYSDRSAFIFGYEEDPNNPLLSNKGYGICLLGQNGRRAQVSIGSELGDNMLFSELNINPEEGDPCS